MSHSHFYVQTSFRCLTDEQVGDLQRRFFDTNTTAAKLAKRFHPHRIPDPPPQSTTREVAGVALTLLVIFVLIYYVLPAILDGAF